ncbi:MAG: TonB family protein [Anaeromyxobacter sp.]|nr:TonB family protein [Anaeromyxobacter sp.]MBL0274881.1 TonB family protein [Anaeromyxobacter sp.]
MFLGVTAPGPRRTGRLAAVQVGSVAIHGAVVAALVAVGSAQLVEAPAGLPVRIVQPTARPAPPPPPAPSRPRPRSDRPVVRRPDRLIAPTVIPDLMPTAGPPEEPLEEAASDDAAPGGVAGGREGGVVGGVVGPSLPAAPPIEARPADLAAVRAGIARTLVYPPEARRRQWQGRTVLAFTLYADGTVSDLVVRESSGFPSLDAAAVEAIRRAAPFDPPGVDVFVVVPVSFRLR